jgi:hydrogenase maturation protease
MGQTNPGQAQSPERTLVVGLGNPIRRDDGVGPAVARAVHETLQDPAAELLESSVGGLDLVERFAGCSKVVIVEAIRTGRRPVGACWKLELDRRDLSTARLGGGNEIGLLEALELARGLDLQMPAALGVYVVEVEDMSSFASDLSPPVAAALPRAVRIILAAEFGRGAKEE